ncbi:hypothetical protein [Natrinema sp. H-ect4]|uniref:hypothetical protein n=1 Tax=Natrinema sp. H-ect4 TaxID=3242699 RepID=UPI0035A8E962
MVLVVGTLLLVGPSFGFSSFAADRGTDIRTAADSNAYLGIESAGDVSGTELRADSDPLRVGTLVNNVDESLEVQDVTIQSIGDGSVDDSLLAVASPTTGDTIAAGDATNVTIDCAAKQSVGPQNVVIRVDGVEGTTIRIAEPTFNATVDIQCGQGKFTGAATFNASDVTTDSTTQTVSFSVDGLGNKGVATIDFSDPQDNGGVDYSSVTDTDLTVQGGKGGVSFDSQSSQLTYTAQGNEKGTVTIELSNIDVDGPTGESSQVTYSDTSDRTDGDIFEIR